MSETVSGLSRRQRREMGITWRGVSQAVRELRKSADWDADAPRKEIAANVALVLMDHDDYAAAWGDNPAELDWALIIEWIEKILPLILKLISLFAFL